ncbi:MAG: T9SS type A sorting domain-containing protein, partial [Bacteroidales bacterium]|nr:T9SS type A sorting domain-containing protein [Bacteroidales bacterium]
DPENSAAPVTSVQLKSRESMILMKSEAHVGVKETIVQSKSKCHVFPVPATRDISIQVNGEYYRSEHRWVDIYSVSQLVSKKQVFFNQGTGIVDVSTLSNGIYFMRVEGIEGVHKFIKR